MLAPTLCCNCRQPPPANVKLKYCAGCRKVWYCCSTCQQSHWVEHIFDCARRHRPINTADYLALAVYKFACPDDYQTRCDYGFMSTLGLRDEAYMMRFWRILLRDLKVRPMTVHTWRVSGVLIQEIQRVFSASPESLGEEYYWFMTNYRHLFDSTYTPLADEDASWEKQVEEITKAAWVFTSGSPHDTCDEINAKISRLPCDLRHCHLLCRLIFAGDFPRPRDVLGPLWMTFGFCAFHPENQMQPTCLYKLLITEKRCTFEELCRAYFTSSLADLFRSKGIILDRYMEDVLSTLPHQLKTVWDLKEHIFGEKIKINGSCLLLPSVALDYGFTNCRDDEEWLELEEVYKLFFWQKDADPLALHAACKSGKLYEYLRGLMKLTPRSKFIRLLKNPCSSRNA